MKNSILSYVRVTSSSTVDAGSWLDTTVLYQVTFRTTKDCVKDAALPFHRRQSGLLLDADGIGMELEMKKSTIEWQTLSVLFIVKAKLLLTQYSSSAFYGAAFKNKYILF